MNPNQPVHQMSGTVVVTTGVQGCGKWVGGVWGVWGGGVGCGEPGGGGGVCGQGVSGPNRYTGW